MSVGIENFINVLIANTPKSINERNVSIIAIFSKDVEDEKDGKIYNNGIDIAKDYGIDSNVYKIGNAVFSQQPNILINNGYVIVFKINEGETLTNAIIRNENNYFGLITTTEELNVEEIIQTANNIQSMNHIFIYCINNLDNANYVGQQLILSSLDKTRILYHSNKLEMTGAYISAYCGFNFNGNNTIINLHSKELKGIEADESIDDNILHNLNNNGVDCYPIIGGVGAVFTSGKNNYFDIVYCELWLKISLENAGFGCLRNTPTKIPQTEAGVSLLIKSYEEVILQAINNGFVAPGKWNLPYTFGNQDLFYKNIENLGYYIYSNSISTQTKEDREARKAPLIQIAIKLAGAINSSDLIVNVNF